MKDINCLACIHSEPRQEKHKAFLKAFTSLSVVQTSDSNSHSYLIAILEFNTIGMSTQIL